MERFIKGDVVIIPFPFSDLSDLKRRPAMVIKNLYGDDIILCQITSQVNTMLNAVSLNNDDFLQGSLPSHSYIRLSRIFTADKNIIIRKAGTLKPEKTHEVILKIIEMIRS